MKDHHTTPSPRATATLLHGLILLATALLAVPEVKAAELDTLRLRSEQASITNSSELVISIRTPSNNISLSTWRVDVRGDFKATGLKQITVNNRPAFVYSNTFEALNCVLRPGTNSIVVIGEDIAGNMATNSIRVIGTADANAFTNDPVQLLADPVGGFAPLKVSFKVKSSVPGTVREVLYDFDGDHVIDRTARDFQPVTHTYAEPGEPAPVATVETTMGRFSSIGSGFGFFSGGRVKLQAPPVLVQTFEVPDPVDLKSTKQGDLYVLSGRAAMITEFDSNGKVVRSLKGIGTMPSGLDVDDTGNVYVAMRGRNQILKFNPTPDSFASDRSFGTAGIIGSNDGSAGSNSNQFNAPFDIAVSPDGLEILISDSGNHRIQRYTSTGLFRNSFNGRESGIRPLKSPRGLVCDSLGQLFIVDAGNNQVVVAHFQSYSFIPRGISGETGASLGQFRSPVNLCTGSRGICVTDLGNNRVQFFDPAGGSPRESAPFKTRFAISDELGLKQPNAVAWASHLLEEKVYVADTGNNRVILLKFPAESPEGTWNAMRQCVIAGDINGALAYFAEGSAKEYREAYSSMGVKDLSEMFLRIPPVKPVFIENDKAQYRFEQKVQGQLITFPIDFVKENGKWKIESY